MADEKVITKKAATNEEVFTYKVIGGLTICNALNLGVDFKKAQEIAVRTYINVLVAKHDKKIARRKAKEELLAAKNRKRDAKKQAAAAKLAAKEASS